MPPPRMTSTTEIRPTITTHSPIRILPRLASRRCNGVGSIVASPRRPAICPNSVSIPVATTTAAPRPSATTVPAWRSDCRSPSGVSADWPSPTRFSAGRLSPVSDDSWVERKNASTSLASAGTWSPASISMRSPITRSWAGIEEGTPSRTTRASGADIARRAVRARWARSSWRKPMTALTRTIATIAAVSAQSPTAPAMIAATIKIQISSSRNWARKVRHQGVAAGSSSLLEPCSASRRAASPAASPRSASVASRRTTSSIGRECQAGRGDVAPTWDSEGGMLSPAGSDLGQERIYRPSQRSGGPSRRWIWRLR